MRVFTRRNTGGLARCAALMMLVSTALGGQVIRPSQAAELMQWVGPSKIQVAYHRPVARGRELFGALAGMEGLSNRVQLVDSPVGKGHVVSFAIRPYWRWQTQGTYFLGFNAIMNWNHLDAGKVTTVP